MHGLPMTNSDNQYQQRKIEALQKENKGLSEKVKTLQLIEDILDMQEEFESLQNLESATIEQTNIQEQSI
ncbi:hypothetical protein [Wolbachia endosymbiont of Trichogramma pretiosum]|uniref:hypothetical protein n=1 Tax=Wolbachia endosymbiont of Trichogramma pretiosum TaxID=125593 RepID=UPI0008387D24|nr:hypothetical protein [Wolbachia endosymbiont of Trichogramma pretiosum]OCA06051.1 putative membrane domain protein [Wolbachia endosymbiont of Trichogramma pretiosum]